jgi:septation ring formation regulator EzrA
VTVLQDRVLERADPIEVVAHRPTRNWRPLVWILLPLAAVGGLLTYVAGNELQANTQFHRASQSLDHTDGRIDVAVAHLKAVRSDLQFLNTQIDVSQRALSSDTTLLEGIRSALTEAQQGVSEKSLYITNLKTCQTGVEQALNALSVGDDLHAVAALGNVSTPCQAVEASSG